MKTIEIVQYLKPSGNPALIFTEVPDELFEIAKDLIISGEWITPTQIVLYAHRKGEPEEDELSEIAEYGTKNGNPQQALISLIKRFERRNE